MTGALLGVLVYLVTLLPMYNGQPIVTNTAMMQVCVAQHPPMSVCGNGTQAFTGYDVEVFRRAALLSGLKEGVDYEFTCMAFTDIIYHFFLNDGKCGAAPGVAVTTAFLDAGILFSRVIYRNGLIIAVPSASNSYQIFSIFSAFSVGVWLTIAATAIAVGIIVYIVDRILDIEEKNRKMKLKTVKGRPMSAYIWSAVGRPVSMAPSAHTIAGNFLLFVFCFMMLLLVALYVGATTTNLVTSQINSDIQGIEDLPGKVVGTWTDYTPVLQRYGVYAQGFPWVNTSDELAMIESLNNKTIDALVLDASTLTFRASNSCDIVIVNAVFDPFDEAIAFPPGTNASLIESINYSIIQLMEDGVLSSLERQYVSLPEPKCKSGISSDKRRISLAQIAGLWVVLAIGIGIVVCWVILNKLLIWYENKKLEKKPAVLNENTRKNKTESVHQNGKNIDSV